MLSATHTVALKPDEGESSWLAADWHCCCAKGMRVGGELGGGADGGVGRNGSLPDGSSLHVPNYMCK